MAVVEFKKSSDLNFLEQKKRLEELEELELEIMRDLEAKRVESAEAVILDRPFDLSLVADLVSRLEQAGCAIEILKRRIASYLRSQPR